MRNKLWGFGYFIMIVAAVLLLAGCVTLIDEHGNVVEIQKTELGVAALSSEVVRVTSEETLHALVKGSIYESGEQVSVFGACLNGDDQPFNTTYATFSVWYPNGTAFIVNQSLSEIQMGYYLYTASMSAVQGTYLTELVCHINGSNQIARAFGEWQNPYWVARIALLNESISNLEFGDINITGNVSVDLTAVLDAIADQTQNFTITIGNLQQNMTDSFEITWDMIESVNVTVLSVNESIHETLIWVAGVANSSVDRNDSLIVMLLYQLLNETTYVPPFNNSLYWNETPDDRVIYYKNWNIDVEVYNYNDIQLGWPIVACYINTTNIPPSDGVLMTGMLDNNANPYFTHSEKIKVLDGFTWVTWCVYN